MPGSLGPCADALGISIMAVFAVGVAQLPIMIALALHFPAVRVDVYSTSVRVGMDPATNASAVVLPASVTADYHMHGINTSGLFVVCAASFCFFVVLTMHLLDRSNHNNMRDKENMNEQEFTKQNVALVSDPSFRTWNQAFVAVLLAVHFNVILTVCSPASMELLLSCAALLYVSICQLVQPLDNFCEDSDAATTGAASMAAQSNMVLCLIYCITLLLALSRIVLDPYAGKTQVVLVLACLDAFMLFGHLWDRVPVVQVRLLSVFLQCFNKKVTNQ